MSMVSSTVSMVSSTVSMVSSTVSMVSSTVSMVSSTVSMVSVSITQRQMSDKGTNVCILVQYTHTYYIRTCIQARMRACTHMHRITCMHATNMCANICICNKFQ